MPYTQAGGECLRIGPEREILFDCNRLHSIPADEVGIEQFKVEISHFLLQGETLLQSLQGDRRAVYDPVIGKVAKRTGFVPAPISGISSQMRTGLPRIVSVLPFQM